jgi:ABC-type branched-subunit amino acid transport system substrate-binding protein
VDPKYPVSTLYSNILKKYGKINVALYALAISPDSLQGSSAVKQSLERGAPKAKVVVDDRSVPYTADTNFTTAALTAKQAGVNVVWSNLAGNDNAPLAVAYKQAGIKTKGIFFPDGYSPALIRTPAWAGVQGATFEVLVHPFYEPNAGTRQMQAAVMKYAGWTKSQFPTFTQSQAWLGAQLMIQGIQGAGSNPTRSSVMKYLRSITSWNGNGLLPFNINYATGFGKMSSPNCVWLTKAARKGYVPQGRNPVCGTYIPGTTSVSS